MQKISDELTRAIQLAQAGQVSQAETICRQIVNANPRIGDAWHLLGRYAYDQQRYSEAISHLSQAAELLPQVPMIQRYLGLSFRALGKTDLAVHCYHRALSIKPNYLEVLLSLGNVLQEMGRLTEAEAAYRQCLEQNPNHAETLNNLGAVLHRQGKQVEAKQHFLHSIALRPDFAEAKNNLEKLEGEQLASRSPMSLPPPQNDHWKEAAERNDEGNRLQAKGNLIDAAQNFRLALELRPDFAEAHNNLANVLQQQGIPQDAIVHYRQAISSSPRYREAYLNLATAFRSQKQWADAADSLRKALALDSNDATTWNVLGNVLRQQGKFDEAVAAYQRARLVDPQYVLPLHSLGMIFGKQGKSHEAVSIYRELLTLQPHDAVAHNNLGATFQEQNLLPEAVASFRRALECKPDFVEAHNNLGTALKMLGQFEAAERAFRSALQIDPHFVEAIGNLGIVLKEQRKLEDAIDCYRRALELRPHYADGFSNLGNALKEHGQLDEAITAYRQAIEIDPKHAQAHTNLGISLLVSGQWEEAWTEYEWRWHTNGLSPRVFSQPVWNGESLVEKTILLYGEQGLGDTLQFVRYASLLRKLGATVFVECQKPLTRVLEGCIGVRQVFAPNEAVPPFDFQAALMSVPRILKTNVDTVPRHVPYIFARPALVEQWRRRIEAINGFKIGIAWKGSASYHHDRFRSIPLRCFEPLAKLRNVRLICLQKEVGLEQLNEVGNAFPIVDFGSELDQDAGPFMDTAAILKNLDLVICADSAVGHLAGALGVPAWLAVPYTADWRWMLKRTDSPWYPNTRLFRQQTCGDWEGVFREMAAALNVLIDSKLGSADKTG